MSSAPATEFPRFLDLPFEIRWAIYELCLPTRVVDSDIRELETVPKESLTREERLALRHIVAKFSRTPVIARASPELYREMQRHVVAPPYGEWIWNWYLWEEKGFTDPRPVYFDQRTDVLCISLEEWGMFQEKEECLEKGPYRLADGRNATVAFDEYAIYFLVMWERLANYCLVGRKKCTIILEETTVIEPMEWIVSCGLFGLFGEERTVLVDVDNFELIDCFASKLNDQNVLPGRRCRINRRALLRGLRRYSSHGTVDFRTAWCEQSPVVSAEERAQIIAKAKEEIMCTVRQLWLEINGCFDGTDLDNPSFVPSNGERGYRDFDEEHPNARLWYEKLPAFSFAVRVHARDLEEKARLSSAEEARERAQQLQRELILGRRGSPQAMGRQ